jgi:predicted nucleotidyltransferase
MVEGSVVTLVKRYLSALPEYGIHARKAVLFGSFARGQSHEWSDIDLIVIAPEFDATRTIELVKQLWLATVAADTRIEPIPCGEQEWETEGGRPVLEIARREGIIIAA